MKRLIFLSIFLTLAVLTTHGQNSVKNEPNYLTNIPKDAFWKGGEDGGQWYLIVAVDSTKQIIHFKIYDDFSGDLTIDKVFRLFCNKQTKIDWRSIKNNINGFDGQRIYLNTQNTDKKCCYLE